MGQPERVAQAESNEASAVEILKELKAILKVPEGESIILWATNQVALMSELAFAVRMELKEGDQWPGYLRSAVYVNPNAPRYVLYQGQSALNEALHRTHMMIDIQENQAKKPTILTPGNGKARL